MPDLSHQFERAVSRHGKRFDPSMNLITAHKLAVEFTRETGRIHLAMEIDGQVSIVRTRNH